MRLMMQTRMSGNCRVTNLGKKISWIPPSRDLNFITDVSLSYEKDFTQIFSSVTLVYGKSTSLRASQIACMISRTSQSSKEVNYLQHLGSLLLVHFNLHCYSDFVTLFPHRSAVLQLTS